MAAMARLDYRSSGNFYQESGLGYFINLRAENRAAAAQAAYKPRDLNAKNELAS